MSTKNCLIIHGCPSDAERAMSPDTRTYDKHWLPWLKRQLIASNIPTEAPLMPEPWAPDYDKFKQEFEKYQVNENSILVGHSCGGLFLVRWLGETKKQIDKLIMVAPWRIISKGDKSLPDFYAYNIDDTIKNRVNKIIIFTSNNERVEGKQGLDIFHKVLGGTVISLPNHGHYTFRDMGIEEFPELLQEVLN